MNEPTTGEPNEDEGGNGGWLCHNLPININFGYYFILLHAWTFSNCSLAVFCLLLYCSPA